MKLSSGPSRWAMNVALALIAAGEPVMGCSLALVALALYYLQ